MVNVLRRIKGATLALKRCARHAPDRPNTHHGGSGIAKESVAAQSTPQSVLQIPSMCPTSRKHQELPPDAGSEAVRTHYRSVRVGVSPGSGPCHAQSASLVEPRWYSNTAIGCLSYYGPPELTASEARNKSEHGMRVRWHLPGINPTGSPPTQRHWGRSMGKPWIPTTPQLCERRCCV